MVTMMLLCVVIMMIFVCGHNDSLCVCMCVHNNLCMCGNKDGFVCGQNDGCCLSVYNDNLCVVIMTDFV